jgi:cytoskeletal protein RodZ
MELNGVSFGEELKRERELREISLREVSESTKISLRYLEALERNDFENLPGGVFNRGFVRAYSKFIGVDPESMVDAYLLEESTRSSSPATDRPGRSGDAAAGRSNWIWWLVGVLIAAAAAYAGWTYWRAATNPASTAPEVIGSEQEPV